MKTAYDTAEFREGLKRLELSLPDETIDHFLTFYECLTEANRRVNLTAITSYEEVVRKHFLDALTFQYICPRLEEAGIRMEEGTRLIDVGTGAGIPGIPLKLAYPGITVTLLDSLQKRIRFLEEVRKTLPLSGVTPMASRAEDLAKEEAHREGYAVAVSRAVAGLPVLLEYCLPFVREGGCFLAYKGADAETEISEAAYAAAVLGAELFHVERCTLPLTKEKRCLLLYRKTAPIPAKYPRKAGMPKKRPLISG